MSPPDPANRVGDAPTLPARRETTAEGTLRARDRELHLIAENFPEGALYQYTIDADGRRMFTFVGRGFERIFGERPPAVPCDISWLTKRIHPADEPEMARAGERSHVQMTRFHHEARVRAADGGERWVSFRSEPRKLSDGSIVWDGAIIDVTERRRAEEAARRQAAFLTALNQTTLELLGRRNVTELLHALADRAATLLRSPHAEISLLENGELVVRAFSSGRDFLAGDRVGRDQPALSWRAIETRAPVVAGDYRQHPDSREVYRARGIHAAAVFPILRGADCVGVLGVAREQAGMPFTTEDIQEGTLLAQMAALVLNNAAIHEEAVREAEARTQALRESEERFRVVFDKSPIIAGLLTLPEGKIVELNAAALAAYGYTRDEVIGKTTLDLNLWVDAQQREGYLRRLQDDGAVFNFEAEMRRKTGETLTVLHNSSVITIGGRLYTLSCNEDITVRKRSDVSRQRTLSMLRATLESTADGILVVNADGRIETYNQNFAEMWRLAEHAIDDHATEERLLLTILEQLVEPERFLASVRDLYSGSEDEVFDVLHCKDGRVFERFSRPQMMVNHPAGRVWSFRDITEQRRAEAALRESEEKFRVLAEVSPAGIFSTDPTGQTTFVNRRWCELAGMSAEQALGDGWFTALHPDDRERIAQGWSEAVRHGESSAAEYRFVRPDGTITWLVGQSRAHFDAHGALAGYVGTITDVTSLKRAEEERKKLEAQSRQSRKMESLGTLAGGIAHDFNNILNGTFGFVDLARLELPEGHPAHEWLSRIAASSQRARELVRQILTFSRKNDGERVVQHLNPVVGEALRLLRSTLPAMVEIDAQLASDAPPVRADGSQMHQVVLNLCTNAWHAMPRGGRLIVALEPWEVSEAQAAAHPDLRPGLHARLSVADNGSGMDAATLEQIFEPFFTTKETGAGTGLGLAVVHGIVKSHEGAIIVRSTVGHGSTFELYFPAAPESEIEPPEPLEPRIPRGNGERILVVDDDAVSGFALEKLVESLGYTVHRCTRPEEALARFAAAPSSYDLVVTDLAMPGMDGEELIEQLALIRPSIPVVVASGYVEPARQRLLEKTIARAVLRKPVSRDELARTVAQHLPARR